MINQFSSLLLAVTLVSSPCAGEHRSLAELLCGSKVIEFRFRKTIPGMKVKTIKVQVQRRSDGVDLVRSDSDEPDAYQISPDGVTEERNWFTLFWNNMVVGEKKITVKEPKGRNIIVEVLSMGEVQNIGNRTYKDCLTLLVRLPGVQVEKRVYSRGIGLVKCEVYRSDDDYALRKKSDMEELISYK